MKKFNLIIIAAMVLLMAACGGKKEAETTVKNDTMQHSTMAQGVDKSKLNPGERMIYYTCPMDSHKHIHGSEPGKCSECGMDMVLGVVTLKELSDFYGCPMEAHSHVRTDQPGTCADCGMKLKPMRLFKG